jgi:Domain of unknown function (DUF4062)/WD domain, G-beta repeat
MLGDFVRVTILKARTRTLRLFVSSTFDDFAAERDALQRGVWSDSGELLVESPFARLRDRCAAHGADLEVVDLRWGISAAASESHATMQRCLAEVRRAAAAPDPNFLALVGDRYGWRPVPATLPADRFVAMVAAAPQDAELLGGWYRHETNSIPATYVLRSDRGRLSGELERRLRLAVKHAWTAAGGAPDGRFWSATEQEIRLALEDRAAGARGAGLCFHRRIVDLPHGDAAARFQDRLPDGRPDEECTQALAALVADLERDPRVTFRDYEVAWGPEGPAGDLTSLVRFVEQVHAELDWRIGETLDELDRWAPSAEGEAHDTFAESRLDTFVGRQRERDAVKAYLERPAAGPLVVNGPGGSGKTTLLAWAGSTAKGMGHRVEHRFIGISAASSVGDQVASALVAEGTGTAPQSDPVDALRTMLSTPPEVTTTVVIDGIDLLPDGDELARFRWLPQPWPSGLRVVLATRSDNDVARLQRVRPDTEAVRLGPLTEAEATSLFDTLLSATKRTVSPEQRAVAAAALAGAVTTPLYVRMLASAASSWSVADKVAAPARDLDGIIRQLFDGISAEDRHGEVLVAAVCRLLAASRLGLASAELLDALSADERVMAAFRQRSPDSPPVDTLPPIVWSALRADLGAYLGMRSSDGLALIDFFHLDLRLAAEARYLDGSERAGTHRRLAELFTRRGTSDGRRWLGLARRPATEAGHHRLAAGDDKGFDALVRDGSYLLAAAGQQAFEAGRTLPVVNPAAELVALLRRRGAGDPAAARAAEALAAGRELLAVHPQRAAQLLSDDGFPVSDVPALAGIRARRVDDAPRPSQEHGSSVTALAVSADGTHIASGDVEGRVGWRTIAMDLQWCDTGHEERVTAIAISPNGRTVASGGNEGAVLLWDTATMRVQPVRLPPVAKWPQVAALGFADDSCLLVFLHGRALAVDVESGSVREVGDTRGLERLVEWDEPDRLVFSGLWLASCIDNDLSQTAQVTVVDVLGDAPRQDHRTKFGSGGVALGRGHLLLSNVDGFHMFDRARPGDPPRRAPGPLCSSLSSHRRLGFVGLDRHRAEILAVGDDLDPVVVARLPRQQDDRGLPLHLRSSPGTDLIAVSWSAGAITLVDPAAGQEVTTSTWSPRIFRGAIDPSGRTGAGLVTCEVPDRSRRLALASAAGAPAVTSPPHTDHLVDVASTASGQVVSVDRGGGVLVHHDGGADRFAVGVEVASACEWRGVDGVAIGTTDGRVLLVGRRPDEVRIGHPAAGYGRVTIARLDASGMPPSVAAALLNGLTAWGGDGNVQWRPEERSDTYPPTAVRLLPDGRVADGNLHGRVRVWDPGAVEPVLEWDAHVGAVQSLQEVGEHLVLSAGASGSIFIVDLPSRIVLAGVMVFGGLVAARVVGDELVVLRRDGWLARYRLEGVRG